MFLLHSYSLLQFLCSIILPCGVRTWSIDSLPPPLLFLLTFSELICIFSMCVIQTSRLLDFQISKHDVKQDGGQAVVRRRMTSKRRRVEQKDDTEERAEETETSSSVLKRQRLPAVQHGVQPSQATPTQNTQRVLGDNYSDCVQPVVKQQRQDGHDTKNGSKAASTEQADIACRDVVRALSEHIQAYRNCVACQEFVRDLPQTVKAHLSVDKNMR